MILEEVLPLSPLLFFKVRASLPKKEDLSLKTCFKKPYLLPNFSPLLGERSFADVAGCYSLDGLTFAFHIHAPFTSVEYPEYEKGDAIELAIDTRNVHTARIFHRFCHHFLILSDYFGQTSALEITRFRGEDRHELCRMGDIEVQREFSKTHYKIKVHFPSHILHGFDPTSYPLMGFTYKIHRAQHKPQHFHLSSYDYNVMTVPMLYAELSLG